jgi:LPPG:FO 2-phospho-L-lactate transferase
VQVVASSPEQARRFFQRERASAVGSCQRPPHLVCRLTRRHGGEPTTLFLVKVVALAGGIGAGRFLRGMVRLIPGADLTVVLNVADDIVVHGLHVSPDPDSVTYWLGDAFDRERGWGRRGETFRATEELRMFGAHDAWFNLGDLDLATHVLRTSMLREGATMSDVVARVAARFGVTARLMPVTDDDVQTHIDAVDAVTGEPLDLHFQEYWVKRRAADHVKGVRFEGIDSSRPAPGVLDAIARADVVVLPPSNPVVSLGPILAVPGLGSAVESRRPTVVGVSGIIGGAPLAGMADKLMPAVGLEVSAAGAASAYDGLLGAWVIDERDRALAGRIEATGVRVIVTDSVMRDDDGAERLAAVTLGAMS